jgi:protein involved in polysaccharide export with SLBB domain
MKTKLLILLLLTLCSTAFADKNQSVVYVTGLVNRPGVFEFSEEMSAWDAIASAKGISRLGRPEFIIKRKKTDTSVETYHYDFTDLSKEKQIEKMKSIKLRPEDKIWLYDRETADSTGSEPVG